MGFDVSAQSTQSTATGYTVISNKTFSQKMYQEYEKAKIIGFAGTYEEYLTFRDFT